MINYFRDYKLENAAQVGGRPIAVGLRSHDLGPAYLALDGKCHGLNYCLTLLSTSDLKRQNIDIKRKGTAFQRLSAFQNGFLIRKRLEIGFQSCEFGTSILICEIASSTRLKHGRTLCLT